MKGAKVNHEKRSAEKWVEIARTFGEKCVEIQHDPKLSIDQKLEKQKSLGKEMAQEIQADTYLADEHKHNMIKSIQSYLDDWTKMHDMILNRDSNSPDLEKKSKKKK